jgi:hypothetical protein
MPAAVGNGGGNRVRVGTAFSHYEVLLSRGWPLTDAEWKAGAYRELGNVFTEDGRRKKEDSIRKPVPISRASREKNSATSRFLLNEPGP